MFLVLCTVDKLDYIVLKTLFIDIKKINVLHSIKSKVKCWYVTYL